MTIFSDHDCFFFPDHMLTIKPLQIHISDGTFATCDFDSHLYKSFTKFFLAFCLFLILFTLILQSMVHLW